MKPFIQFTFALVIFLFVTILFSVHCDDRIKKPECTPDASMCGFEVEETLNQQYADNYSRHQDFNFYRPVGWVGPRPLILFAHPGVFVLGDKSDYFVSKICKDIARCGYATAGVNYRLLTDFHDLPDFVMMISNGKNPVKSQLYDAVRDIHTAIRFFKANHKRFNIDPQRVYLAGYSAGAVLALQVAFMDDSERNIYFDESLMEKFDKCLDCLPFIGEDTTFPSTVDASLAGVISINGALFSHEFIKDKDRTPVLLMYSDGDKVIPYGSGKPFAGIVNRDLKLDLPSIAFELAISPSQRAEDLDKTTVDGLRPSVVLPAWIPAMTNHFTPTLLGSVEIKKNLRGNNQIRRFEGGHNFFMEAKDGTFNCNYDKVRWSIKNFVEGERNLDERSPSNQAAEKRDRPRQQEPTKKR